MKRRKYISRIGGLAVLSTAVPAGVSGFSSTDTETDEREEINAEDVKGTYIAELAGLNATVEVGELQQAYNDYQDGEITDATWERAKELWSSENRIDAEFESSVEPHGSYCSVSVEHVGNESVEVEVVRESPFQDFTEVIVMEPGDSVSTGTQVGFEASIAVNGDEFTWEEESTVC